MKYNESNVSNKSQLTALVYLFILGKFGAHRFYVSKYITGLLFFLVSATQVVLNYVKSPVFLEFSFDILFLVMLFVDIVLIYTDKYTDKAGDYVLGVERIAIIEGEGDFEKLRFISKLDKFIFTFIIIAVYITILLLDIFVIGK